MEISDWHGAREFELLRQRAIGFRSQQSEALAIEWYGEGKDLARMADPNSDPKSEWINPHRDHPLERFICWLMLPKDVSGGDWYFGRVSTRHRSKTQELDEFLAIASKGGHLLRQDTLFGKYLSPCVEHTKFVQRFSGFHDHLDLSFWCAFLFTNRGLSHPPGMLPTKQQSSQEHPGFPIDFPYAKFKGGDDVVEGSISAVLQFTGKLISHWALNTSQPARPLASVARRFVWPTEGRQAGTGNKPLPPATDGFLDLNVDRDHRTVSRKGCDPRIDLASQAPLWHIFLKMFDAGENGTTRKNVLNGYPADVDGVKHVRPRLNNELIPLSIAVEPREWRLVCTKTRSQK